MAKYARIDGDALFMEVMQLDQVRAGVNRRASRIMERAIRYTSSAGGVAEFSTEPYTLSNGRYGVDVTCSDSGEEYGGSGRKRIRALRRAAREEKR
nr:MAG TPA: hypothetical protein [Caudoviricetes sp.]